MASKLAREGEEQAMKLLKRAFEDTDTDKSGTICARELKQLFEKAGLHDTTDAEIQVSGLETRKLKPLLIRKYLFLLYRIRIRNLYLLL